MKKPVAQQELKVYTYEDDETKSIWTYDYSIMSNGPISVEIIYKNEPEVVPKKKKTKKKKNESI